MKEITVKLLNDLFDDDIQYSYNGISMYKTDRRSKLCRGRSAVYILLGPDFHQVYIGQTTNIYNRLYQHSRTKQFWDTAIFFTNDNREFTPTEIKWLEEKLIKMIVETHNFNILSNYQIPNNVSIIEKDAPELIELFNTIKLLLDMFWRTTGQINDDITNNRKFDIVENTYNKSTSKSIVDRIAKESYKNHDVYEPDEDGIVTIINDDINASYFDLGDGRIFISKNSLISTKNLKDRLRVLGQYSGKIQNFMLIEDIIVSNEKTAKIIIGI